MYPMRKYVVLFGMFAFMQLFRWSASGQESSKVGNPTPTPRGSSVVVGQTVGISSCSGGGCHGAAIPKGTPALSVPKTDAWRCAYTHWLSYDNHAKAFNVLREERAREMMVRLSGQTVDENGVRTFPVRVKDADGIIEERRAILEDGKEWKVQLRTGESGENLKILSPARYHPDATQESRCLACHVNPSLAFTPTEPRAKENVESHRRQGVGCEACHGNASSWRDSHVKWPDGPGKKQLYAESGMIWLNDSVARARACAGCHVGAPPDEISPEVRNMNHDMIAAGHPRLNFEYNNYQLLETPHWIEKDRTKSDPQAKQVSLDASFYGRNWLIGRSVQMEQAIALLEYRTRPESPEATDFTSLEKEAEATRAAATAHRIDPWPELAEFNCYACHQSLRPDFYTTKEPERKFPFAKKTPLLDPSTKELFANLVPPFRPVGFWVWDPLFGTARVFHLTREEVKAHDSFIKLQREVHLKNANRAAINKLAKVALRDWRAVSDSLLVPESLQLEKRRELLYELPNPARWDDLAQTYLGIRGMNNNQGNKEIEEKLFFPYQSQSDRQDSPQNYGPHLPEEKPQPFDPKKAREAFIKDIAPIK